MQPQLPEKDPELTDFTPISPRWSPSTKFLIWLVCIVVVGALIVRFQELVGPLLFAGILAYILTPVIRWLTERTHLSWGIAVVLVYLVIVILLLAVLIAAGIAIDQQIIGLSHSLLKLTTDLPAQVEALLQQPINFFGLFTLDLSNTELKPLYDQIVDAIRPALSQMGTIVGSLASQTASVLGWLFFIIIISFYLLHDLKHLTPSLEKLVPQAYRYDARRLASELGPIWDAFLRGQIILALVMGIVVGLTMALLGVRYAFVLGLLSGLLEFVPIVGPFIAGAAAVLIALFQPDNWFNLAPFYYALLVLGVSILLQQVENNLLVPRILGDSLELHPILILVGAIIGASLAGVLGLLLSAPTIATLRLFGRYVYRKLFDIDPWPPAPPKPELPPKREWPRWLRLGLPKKISGADEPPDD